MTHEEFTLRTPDGLQLYGQGWQLEGDLRGAIALVHGIGEHTGRYAAVAQHLIAAGYALYGTDLRGHGRSPGQRGHIPSWDVALDDIGLLLADVAQRFPGVPHFLYGHSLGGILVITYGLRRRPAGLAGVVASAPQLRLAFQPSPLMKRLGELTYNVLPTFTQKSGLDVNALSHDPKVVTAYTADPLVHGVVSARLGIGLIREGEWALAHADEWPQGLPLLILHGTADRLTLCAASREFAGHAGAACTLIPWEGLYHELHNEPEHEQVLAAMIAWLDAHRRSEGGGEH